MTRVLIAEQDIPTRLLLQKSMAQWGYTVVEATNALDVMTTLNLTKPAPQLILLDWKLAGMDNFTLCKKIKEELTHPPLIMLLLPSDYSHLNFKAMAAGADEILIKPFTIQELTRRLSLLRLDAHNRLRTI